MHDDTNAPDSIPLAAVASLAAGAIHATAAGVHADHRAAAAAFTAVAAAQLVVGAWLLVRPSNRPKLACAGINALALVGWAVAKSVGIGWIAGLDQPEPVATADVLAAALAGVASVGAASPIPLRPAPPALRRLASVLVVVLGATGVVTTGDHTRGHDHDEPPATSALPDPGDRCDLGFNTALYNATGPLVADSGDGHSRDHAHGPATFTLEQWAGVFVEPERGIPAQVVVDSLASQPVQAENVLSGEMAPSLAPDPWIPMTDRDGCAALAGELDDARAAAIAHPTVADAEADGYHLAGRYAPGQGAHYTNRSLMDGTLDPARPEMLLYGGTDPRSPVVGVSYYVLGETPPEGFTGPNDLFHAHRRMCLADGIAVGAGTLDRAECASLGGTLTGTRPGWMAHAWVVAGCESDWGMFSAANPAIQVQPDDAAPTPPGCWTGRPVDAPLDLDDTGAPPARPSGRLAP